MLFIQHCNNELTPQYLFSDDDDQYRAPDYILYISYVLIILFPPYMTACQYLLHKRKGDRAIRKRSMAMIRVASLLPGYLAWINVIISLNIGIPCWIYHSITLLVAPLSIGPQLTRAIRLWSMFKLSHLVLNQDVISVKRGTSKMISDLKRAGTVSNDQNAAVAHAIEAAKIKSRSKTMARVSFWGLLVLPTSLLLIVFLLLSDPDDLSANEFDDCFPAPPSIRYFSPANGLLVAMLAISGTILLRNSSDELGIRHEITRNVVLWALTYIVVLILRILGHDLEYQAIIILVQQMVLTYSMIVLPVFHANGFFFFCFGGGAMILPEYSVSSIEGRSYRSERSVNGSSAETTFYESGKTGLQQLLSTESGIKKFSEHCAREFSIENIRFWQAINQYRNESFKDHLELLETAEHIFDEYVKPGCENQVNLPMTMVKKIQKALKTDADHVDTTLFDQGQNEIFNLMSRDSYQRFIASRQKAARNVAQRKGSMQWMRRRSLSG